MMWAIPKYQGITFKLIALSTEWQKVEEESIFSEAGLEGFM